MLSAGNPFPRFSLPNQDGKITNLGDFAGHWLVVYFYPKDDTPGCTGFRAGRFRQPRTILTMRELKLWA